jgi:aspartyl-tRNA(Asn)/glutamyl-tRNA(Gln) amidotransferase subunit C
VSDDVTRTAALARLEFSGPERERFVTTFEQILAYFRQLERVPTDGVEPTYHALDEAVDGTPLRPDEVTPSLDAEQVLRGAPDARDGHFRVPRVIE